LNPGRASTSARIASNYVLHVVEQVADALLVVDLGLFVGAGGCSPTLVDS
jgi:hypothetical protein